MKLYLSSFGLGNKTEELENWIDKHGNEIVLIPNAQDIHAEGERKQINISRDVEALTLVPGFDVKVISLHNYFGNPDKLKKDFEKYHAFFAIGGNVFALRKAMQLSGFDKFLKDISKKDDYLYGGYSAGICVLSPKLQGFDLVDPPINPYNADKVLYDGIGLLDYMPIPHCNLGHAESEQIQDVIEYCNKHSIKHKKLKDGEAIIEEIGHPIEREHDDR